MKVINRVSKPSLYGEMGGEKTAVVGLVVVSFHLDRLSFQHKAGFGITVYDDYRNRGQGTMLTKHILDIARQKKM